jgi:hypothetical protein
MRSCNCRKGRPPSRGPWCIVTQPVPATRERHFQGYTPPAHTPNPASGTDNATLKQSIDPTQAVGPYVSFSRLAPVNSKGHRSSSSLHPSPAHAERTHKHAKAGTLSLDHSCAHKRLLHPLYHRRLGHKRFQGHLRRCQFDWGCTPAGPNRSFADRCMLTVTTGTAGHVSKKRRQRRCGSMERTVGQLSTGIHTPSMSLSVRGLHRACRADTSAVAGSAHGCY